MTDVTTVALLRHALATIAYRAGKAFRDAPSHFGSFRAAPSMRSPHEIVAHMSDVFDSATSMVEGVERWRPAPPIAWRHDVERWHSSLAGLDESIASSGADLPAHRLLQGPIADALTHTGQLTMLRRLCGAPIRGEDYATAEIVAGRLGTVQAAPRREFD